MGRHHAGAVAAKRAVALGEQRDQALQGAIEADRMQQEAVIAGRGIRQSEADHGTVRRRVQAGIDDGLEGRAVIQPHLGGHGDNVGAGDGDAAVMRPVFRGGDGVERADLADGVIGPAFIGQMGAAGQHHAALAQAEADVLPAIIRHRQHAQQPQFGHFQHRRLRPLQGGGGQRHFRHARGRQHGSTAKAVIGQPGFQRGINPALPFLRLFRATEAQQAMVMRGGDDGGGIRRARQRHRHAGQWRQRQRAQFRRAGIDRRLTRVRTLGHGAVHQSGERVARQVPARQAGEQAGFGAGFLQRVAQVGLQHRIAADFDEQARPGGGGVHRAPEAHPVAQVVPPVIRGAFPRFQYRGGDGGDHARAGRVRLHAGKVADQGGLHRVHRRTVEGVIQFELDETPAPGGGNLLQPRQHRLRPGDGEGARAVFGGDLQLRAGQAGGGFRQSGQGFIERAAKRGHAANAALAVLLRAAGHDQACGGRQVQQPGGPGGGHFPDRVAQHRVGDNPLGAQGFGDGDLGGEQQRLGDIGGDQFGSRDAGANTVQRRPAKQRRQHRIHLGQCGAETRVVLRGLLRHRRDLRAIAGINQHDAAGTGRRIATGHLRPGGGAIGGALDGLVGVGVGQPGTEALPQRIRAGAAQHQTVRLQVAEPGGAAQIGRQIGRGDAAEFVQPRRSQTAQGGRGVGGEQQGRQAAGGGFGAARRCRGAGQHGAAIGAAEAEAVDADGGGGQPVRVDRQSARRAGNIQP